LSTPRRNALALGAAALIGALVTVLAIGTWPTPSPDPNGDRKTARSGEAPLSPRPRDRSSWTAEANSVCSLAQKLYPSIALGADADPDTMDYAVHRLVSEIKAIRFLPAAAVRARLVREGDAAASAWLSLATRPIDEVTQRERRDAERLTAGYVDELVALGAGACSRLRPAA
jgi:hypothetical protein